MNVISLLLLLVNNVLLGEVVDFNAEGMTRKFHGTKESCHFLGHPHVLYVEILGPGSIDCMGKTLRLTRFCEKKYGRNVGLLRGRIDVVENKVICEFAKQASLKISCLKQQAGLCQNPVRACRSLRHKFATQLEVIHSSVVPKGTDQFLNCYFAQKLTEGIIDLN